MNMQTTLNDLLKQYKTGTMTELELLQLDKMLVGGFMYRQEQKKWLGSMAENNLVPLTDTVLTRTDLNRWIQLRTAIISIAAVLLVAVCSIVWRYSSESTVLSQAKLMEIALNDAAMPLPQTRMGAVKEINNSWEDARNALLDKNYAQAITLLNKMPQRSAEQTFFLGMSYLKRGAAGDLTFAITHFKKVIELHTGNYEKEARWYLALSYLKNEDKDMAATILKAIVSENAWKAKEASDLLKSMR